MSLWGKRDSFQLTGTVDTVDGNNVVVGTNTEFTTEVVNGIAITIGSDKFKVTSVVSDTQLTVVPTPDANVASANVFGQELPKVLLNKSIDDIYFIDSEEAQDANNKAIGLGTPGWYEYKTYTDSANNTRHKAELLVEISSANTTVAGDSDNF